ncbi:MAG: hypothetical protein WD187_04570 [Candidatus Woykebacteria bacterium]
MNKHYFTIGAVTIIVIIAIIYGFFAAGTPGEARERKFDQERVSNISSLKYVVEDYYQQNKQLPSRLDDLSTSSYGYGSIKDPETGEEYFYSTAGSTSYKLCATFSTASDEKQDSIYGYYDREFSHPKGYHCFNQTIRTSLYD